MRSCVVILVPSRMLYCILCDELSALSNMKWVLTGISCPSLLFLKSPPAFALSLMLATPPSGSGLFMFFISFTRACVSVSVPVTFGGVGSH